MNLHSEEQTPPETTNVDTDRLRRILRNASLAPARETIVWAVYNAHDFEQALSVVMAYTQRTKGQLLEW